MQRATLVDSPEALDATPLAVDDTKPSDEGATNTLSRGTHYRPQLDGLRAVAVYLVVAFHSGVARFSGGYIGVDVFFVLSGYLVTQLLLRDIGRARRIQFSRFYSRRFRRLLPAAFVTLIVTAIVYGAVVSPSEAADAVGGFKAAFLYVANWYFIRQSTDYFATNVNSNPVLHFWSLAVEEQFYLIWPLLLAGIYMLSGRAGRHRWNVVRGVVAVGALVSFAAAVHISHTNLSQAYYGTGTRAYELFAGALLAMTPQIIKRARGRPRTLRVLASVSLVLLIFIGTSWLHAGPIMRGLAAVVVTTTLILALEVAQRGFVKRTLSSPTAVYLGRVSYGTYLWHWPFIIIVTQRFHPSGVALFALTCLAATGLASLSYQLLERPIRASTWLERYKRPVIALGLAVSVVSGLVIAPAILNRDRGSNVAAATFDPGGAGGWRVPVPAGLDVAAVKAEKYDQASCFRHPVDQCIVVHGPGQRLLLMGDSHALVLAPAFAEIAKRHGLTFAMAVLPNCPWQRGLVSAPPGYPADLPASCRAHQDDWYTRVIPQFDPGIIVVAQRGADDPAGHESVFAPNGKKVAYASPGYEAVLRSASALAIQQLRQNGRKVAIIEPEPLAPLAFDPLACLSRAKYLEQCRYVATAYASPLARYYRSVADGKHVWSLDIDHLICPYWPICDPMVNGVVVKKDPQHITASYSKMIADPIDQLLVRNRIL